MKKDNITEDKKRIKCLIVAKKTREKRRKREKWCCERRKGEKKMKPCLF